MTLFQTRFFKASIILIVALALLLVVMMAVMGFRSSPSATSEIVAEEQLFIRPNMTIAIPVLFDVENDKAAYDFALLVDEAGAEELVETSSFERFGQSYEFLLTTKKANNQDDDFTIPDYLALTLVGADSSGVQNEIVYIDLGADGDLDSVYLNDVDYRDTNALIEAQNQYTTELVLARDYLLGAQN